MLPIVVYGNGDLFREYFTAVALSFGTSSFNTLIKLAMLLAGTSVVFSFIVQRDLMVFVKWFGLYYLVVFVMFTPKVDVEIIDRVGQGHVYTVDNVPLGLAVLASYTSAIGDALTQLTEMNFSMPDDLRYGQAGMVFASRLVTEGSQFEITDSEFDKDLQSFVQQCVFYDVLLKRYSLNELSSAGRLWDFVAANTSPARAFLYDGEVTACKTGADLISKRWPAAIDHAVSQYAPRFFSGSTKPKSELLKYLPISYGYLTKVSSSANDIMQQQLMANALQRGVLRMDGTLNASAAMESYSYTRAQEQKRLTNQTLGDMAAYWLPLMKNAFEAIMYGSFIFIVLLVLFPFGLTVLKNYVFTLLWIQLWAPLYAVINLLVSYYAVVQSSSAAGGTLSLKALPGLLQINSDISGLAGYLTLSVPFLSAGLAKGMASTFTQLSQYVNGVTQSTGSAAAQEAVTGNISLGNTSLANHSSFNTSANHFDTSGRYSAGGFTGQLPGGSTLTAMPDGGLVMNTQGATSNIGTSINLAGAVRNSASRQAEVSAMHTEQEARSYGDAVSSAYRETAELAQHANHSTGTSEGWNISTSASAGQALNKVQQLTERFAHDHQLSYGDAARMLGSVAGDLRVGASVQSPSFGKNIMSLGANAGLSGRREADHSTSADQRKLYSAAEDFVRNTGYSEHLDTVERAVHDKGLKANDERGAKSVESINASFDKAQSAKHDMLQSMQETQSYREMAQQAEEQSLNVNSNLSQVFMEQLSNKPGMNNAKAEDIFLHKPEVAKQYAEEFAQHYTKGLAVEHGHLPVSQQSIKDIYKKEEHKNLAEGKVRLGFEAEKNKVVQAASQHHSVKDIPIDRSVIIETEQKIFDTKEAMQPGRQFIEAEGQVRKQAFNQEEQQHPKRSSYLPVDLIHGIDTQDQHKQETKDKK